MSVWITRSAPDNLRTARGLRALGQRPLMMPVLTTMALDQARISALPDAIVFTSCHAVRHFAGDERMLAVPVFVASALVADAALAVGYITATSAGGSDDALGLLLNHVLPVNARVMMVCGENTSGGMADRLRGAGFQVERRIVYRPVPVADDSIAAAAAALDRVSAIVVHSRGGADRIVPVLRAARWRGSLWCISPQAAQACSGLADVSVQTAPMPSEASLLSMIGRLRPGMARPGTLGLNDPRVIAAWNGTPVVGNDNAPLSSSAGGIDPGPLAG